MVQPIIMFVGAEVVLIVLLLFVLLIASFKKSRNRSPRNVREDVKKIKEQIMSLNEE